MERYTKKSKGLAEIAVVELTQLGGDGMRTTRRMVETETATKEEETSSETAEKRSREVADGELEFAGLRSTRRRVMIQAAAEEYSLSPGAGSASCGPSTSAVEANCASEPVSCCSSNASTEFVQDQKRSRIADPAARTETSDAQRESTQLETLTFSGGRDRSEATPSSESCAEESGDLESTAAARHRAEANSLHKSTVAEMPSESEIDEFFSAAEKNLQNAFSKKYNFDVVKGVPLEGRYEWVRVNP